MSNAIAQSATQLAPSVQPEEAWDYDASVRRQAERTAKGTTRERKLLQRNKLFAAACGDFKSHYPAVYGHTPRLPSDIAQKIEDAVDKFLTEQMSRIHVRNVISYQRRFHFNQRSFSVSEREILTGENILALREQKLGILTFITQAERRLKDLEAKPTPDFEREKAVREQLTKLNIARDLIDREINANGEEHKPAVEE